MLVVFRVIQAAGAALLTPTSLGLILATTAPEKRHGAVRAWTAVGGAAAALGPVVGGLLVAAELALGVLRQRPDRPGRGRRSAGCGCRTCPAIRSRRPDALGATLITAGVALLSLGLVEGNDWGWGSARVIGALVAAVLLLGAFVLRLHASRTTR